MHRGIPLFLDDIVHMCMLLGRGMFIMFDIVLRDGVTPNGCPTSTTTRECSPDQKGVEEVCKPTSRSILERVDHV